MSDDKGALGPEVSGLAHIAATDPQALARERETLEVLAGEGVLTRLEGTLRSPVRAGYKARLPSAAAARLLPCTSVPTTATSCCGSSHWR